MAANVESTRSRSPQFTLARRDLLVALLLAGVAGRASGQPSLPALPFIEVDHVSVRVSNVRRAADFYMRLFDSDASRDPNRPANPASKPGELWFIRLGESHLALAPSSPSEPPGLDHFCLSVSGFDKDAAKARLARFNQVFPEWPSNNVWLSDPGGHLVQIAPSANEPKLPAIVRGAMPVERDADLPPIPPFRATRISRLTLVTTEISAAVSYYRDLLGPPRAAIDSRTFVVGPSHVILAPAGEPELRVAIAAFDDLTVRRTLSSFGVTAQNTPDGAAVAFRDPDGIRVEIAGR